MQQADLDDPLALGPKRYSQHDEELVIRHFFGDRRDGVFLDVGAYDWKLNSTTLYLEKHLGWTGIAVDALERFRAGYEKNRPGTHFFTYIVGERSGEIATIYVADALSSVVEDHLDTIRTHREHIDQFEAKPVQVPTITLTDLLDREGVEKIDFLSMDIEEAEPAALAGFDIERFRPELVCIEVAKRTREPLLAYFSAHGYERIDAYLAVDEVNWYFRPAPSGTD
jgi:FkbM family methyltransferase